MSKKFHELSGFEYLGLCRQRFYESAKLHDEKLALRRNIHRLFKANSNTDIHIARQLPNAINTIIRYKFNLRRLDYLKAEDIPKANMLVEQIAKIINY